MYQYKVTSSFPGYMTEGLADGVRLEFGYHDRYLVQQNPGETWKGSYSTTGNFFYDGSVNTSIKDSCAISMPVR